MKFGQYSSRAVHEDKVVWTKEKVQSI